MIGIEQEQITLDELESYERLWLCVIIQQIMDAKSTSNKSHKKSERLEALDWLKYSNEDFNIVCSNAGKDPQYMRERINEAKKSNFAWREGDLERWIDFIERRTEEQQQFNLFGEF